MIHDKQGLKSVWSTVSGYLLLFLSCKIASGLVVALPYFVLRDGWSVADILQAVVAPLGRSALAWLIAFGVIEQLMGRDSDYNLPYRRLILGEEVFAVAFFLIVVGLSLLATGGVNWAFSIGVGFVLIPALSWAYIIVATEVSLVASDRLTRAELDEGTKE